MANLTCAECGEPARLVRLPQEKIEVYWCHRCFVMWPYRQEPPKAPPPPLRPRLVARTPP